jgi:hypothetical protein
MGFSGLQNSDIRMNITFCCRQQQACAENLTDVRWMDSQKSVTPAETGI